MRKEIWEVKKKKRWEGKEERGFHNMALSVTIGHIQSPLMRSPVLSP